MRHFQSAAVLTAVLVAACQGPADPAEPFTPNLSVGERTLATGSGHTTQPLTDDMRNFTFHAITRPDGSVAGSYRLHRHDIDAWFRVDVTCLTRNGNTAWIGGIISETNVPNIIRVGTVSYVYVIDNGEGGDTPDRVSRVRINDAAGQDQAFCRLQPTNIFDPNPPAVESGNVQVR